MAISQKPRRLPVYVWVLIVAGILLALVGILVLLRDSGMGPCQVVAESTTRGGADPSVASSGVTAQRIVDGDDVILGSNERVRYIGIDAPEPERPHFEEAVEFHRALVEGKQVSLEKDVSETDRYGRLLRYVYVGEVMVNAEMVREGWAKAERYPPDLKYADCFDELQSDAQKARRGIWAN